MTPISATQCQQAVFDVAVELARQDKRLAELAAALPLPEDFDPDTLPSTLAMELYSRIQAVKADHLQPAMAILYEGAQLTDADLRREFQNGVSFRQQTPVTAATPPVTAATTPPVMEEEE